MRSQREKIIYERSISHNSWVGRSREAADEYLLFESADKRTSLQIQYQKRKLGVS